MKVTVKGRQLTEAKCERISLVKRGANRSPIKISKEDKSMAGIDLYAMGSVFKSEKKPNKVVAILVDKTDSMEANVAAIEAAGFKVDQVVEAADGPMVYLQDVAEGAVLKSDDEGNQQIGGKDTILYKVSDDVAFLIHGTTVKKHFTDVAYDSTEFQEVVKVAGVYPSISVASDVLFQVVRNVMATPDVTHTDLIAKAATDYATYVNSILRAVPGEVFKLEKKADVKVEVNEAKPDPKADPKAEAKPEPKTDPKVDPKVEAEDPAEGEDDEEGKQEEVEKIDPVLAAISALTATVTGFGEQLTALKGDVQETATAVKEVGEVATAASTSVAALQKSLKSTVIGAKDTRQDPARDEGTRKHKSELNLYHGHDSAFDGMPS